MRNVEGPQQQPASGLRTPYGPHQGCIHLLKNMVKQECCDIYNLKYQLSILIYSKMYFIRVMIKLNFPDTPEIILIP